jgi:ATP-dependent Clp endopeptidase proteolytic subunit ClpP
MPKKINDLFLSNTAIFHEMNLHLPTRTIYFGSVGVDSQTDSDEVNCRTVGQLIKNLHILETKEIGPITLLLNTPGGSWEDGTAVYDLIKNLKSEVTIIGMGKIWSMGSIIFQAGKKRVIMPNATIMVHDGSDGYIGDSKSFESWAKDSKRVRHVMYNIYFEQMKKKNTKITLKNIENMCSHDKIFTAEEAVKIGLADEIMTN